MTDDQTLERAADIIRSRSPKPDSVRARVLLRILTDLAAQIRAESRT